MPSLFDTYHILLGIAPEHQPADYYQLLGIERLEFNVDVIHNAAERQLDHLRRHAIGDHVAVVSAVEASVVQARDCLASQNEHRKYAAERQGFDLASNELTARADLRSFNAEFDRAWQTAQQIKFDPQYHWLGIPLHQRPASNERMLGVSVGERNPTVIQNAAERQIAFVRKFASGNNAEQANELLRQLGRVFASMKRDQLSSGGQKPRLPAQDPVERIKHHNEPKPTRQPMASVAETILDQNNSVDEQFFQLRSDVAGPIGNAVPGPAVIKTRNRRPIRQTKLSALIAALMWIIPFVLPSAAIFAYIKWSGGGDQLAGPLDVLREASDQSRLPPKSSTNTQENAASRNQKLSVPRGIPNPTHARPARVENDRQKEPPAESALNHLAGPQADRNLALSNRNAQPLSAASIENEGNQTAQAAHSHSSGAYFDQPRKWSTKTGQSFEATIVTLAFDQVTMKSAENGREKSFPMDFFATEDEKVLRIASLDQGDNQQFELVHDLAKSIPNLSEELSTKLTDAHSEYGNSPYAGLWSSVSVSQDLSQHTMAKNTLKMVIDRLSLQQEIDPYRHAMTLSSALNNLALCFIMEHQADAAAGQLVRSIQSMPIPSPVVLHNASFLLKIATQADSQFKLSSANQRNLTQAFTTQPEYDSGLQERWYYALDVDLPTSANSLGDEFRYLSQRLGPDSDRSLLAVRNELCVSCKAIGFHPCRNCNQGIVSVKRQVQVGVNQITGMPLTATKFFRERCNVCNGRGNFDCQYCEAGRLK